LKVDIKILKIDVIKIDWLCVKKVTKLSKI